MLQLPADPETGQDSGSVGCERHRPEWTLLYQLAVIVLATVVLVNRNPDRVSPRSLPRFAVVPIDAVVRRYAALQKPTEQQQARIAQHNPRRQQRTGNQDDS